MRAGGKRREEIHRFREKGRREREEREGKWMERGKKERKEER